MSNRYLFSLSSEQKQWLEQMEAQKIYYYYDGEGDYNLINDVKSYVHIVSKNLKIELIETKDLQYALDNNALIISKSNSWLNKGYSETNAISSNVFSIYSNDGAGFLISDLENSTIGILSSDSEQLNLQELYEDINIKIIEADDIDELYTLYSNKSIDALIIGKEYPALFHQNQLLAKNVYQINAAHLRLNIYVPNDYAILTDILNGLIRDMQSNYSLEIGQNYDLSEWEKDSFTHLLTEEEKEWIQNNGRLKAALSMNPPYTIQFDEKVYGVMVATLKKFERLSGVTIEYIIGENDTLSRDYHQYDLDVLWIRNGVKNVLTTNSCIMSEYVVVGINEAPKVNSVYDLYNYKVGMLFDDKISDEISSLLSQSNLVYYINEETLIRKLLDNKVELIIIPRIVFDYYEQNKDMTQLDIRYTLDALYESKFYLPQNDKILHALLNKTILLQTQTDLINESFGDIPEKKDDNTIIRYTMIMGILIVMFFGGYFIRYLVNAKEKKKLNYMFMHDPLTHLPNKYGLSQYIGDLIQKDEHGVLLLLDIDNFKTINDRHGSQFGDQVLLGYSQRLLSILNENMILGRTGGDEFSLIIKDFNEDEKESTIDKIKAITDDYANSNTGLQVFSISIAITLFPKHGNSFEELYKYAEYAIAELKDKYFTNGVMEFTFEIYEKQVKEQLLVKDVKQSLLNQEFVCYLQPQIILPEEKVVGGEMLVRWQHPEKGLIPPGDFIEILEKTGIIRELDYYMLRKACEQIKIWQDDYPNIKISVNMSPQSLTTSTIHVVQDWLDEIGFNPKNLVMEVTEDMGFKSFDEANKIFAQLKQMGIRVALDDFGKGYSSLSCLEKLSIDILKIDKALVDNIHLKEESKEIFLAITRIAEVMKISIVAEGVEHREQVEILKKKKDMIVQGYYYSKPISIEDFNTYLRTM